MALIQLKGISFGYGGDNLFIDVDLIVNNGDRLAIIGPNGIGKSTLLNIIMKRIAQDKGEVVVSKGVTVGYLNQNELLQEEGILRDIMLKPYQSLLSIRTELKKMDTLNSDNLNVKEKDKLKDFYDLHNGDIIEKKIEALLFSLGFQPSDVFRQLSTFSGGEKRRLALARVMIGNPDLLILDEPTNHLDLDAIEELENFLVKFSGGLIVISHDRKFLQHVANKIAELTPEGMDLYNGGYDFYLKERREKFETIEKKYEDQKKYIKKQEEFIRRNIANWNNKQAKSREKFLKKMEMIEKPVDIWASGGKTKIRFKDVPRSGHVVLHIEKLSINKGERILIDNLSFDILKGDKIGIVGPNGAGKSTLLRTFAKEEELKKGFIEYGHNVLWGYGDQELASLNSNKTPFEEIHDIVPDWSNFEVLNHLGRIGINEDYQNRQIGSLSGGERAKVALAKLLVIPKNLLLLDEPTNNLDIIAREKLEEAFSDYGGSLIVVSHDRYFLDSVANKILYIAEGKADIWHGNYSDNRDKWEWPRRKAYRGKDKEGETKSDYENKKKQKRENEKLQRRYKQLEQDVQSFELEIRKINDEIAINSNNWPKLNELTQKQVELKHKLDESIEEWTIIAEKLSDII